MFPSRLRLHLPALACALLLACGASAQTQAPAPIVSGAATPNSVTQPCCGVITPEGHRLIALLDSLDVEHHWLAREHIDWKTGEENRGGDGGKHDTHCSAFSAAVSLRLEVYLLRPPEHRTTLLASAQGRWLASKDGQEAGWVPVDAMEAQQRANLGEFVVVNYISPDPHKPGHIAVIRPSEKTMDQLQQDGPEVTQAGATNHDDSIAALSFTHHPGAWPNGVRYYAHPVEWSKLSGSIIPAGAH